MGTLSGRRRILIVALGAGLLVLFLVLATLNAFNLNFLNPASPVQALVFISLSVLVFLLFVGVLVLLVRNVLKLYADQRSRILGTRLRTRMLWGAVLVSLVPLVFMFAFSYLLMNRAVDRWFSQPATQIREGANQIMSELFSYAEANARSEADSIAIGISDTWRGGRPASVHAAVPAFDRELQRHELTLQGGFAAIYQDNRLLASLHLPSPASAPPAAARSGPAPDAESEDLIAPAPVFTRSLLNGPVAEAVLHAAQRNERTVYTLGGTDYTLATAGLKQGGLVVVGLPIPAGITGTSNRLRQAANSYWTLFRERRQVRSLYTVLLLLTTGLALFACCWLALHLSKQVTRPVESLADAMEAIAAGDYAHRVGQSATEELGELVESFNAMAADLESAHDVAERSTAQLSRLNSELQERRRELETIIETIPNGVVTLSPERTILLTNRAFSELLDPGGQQSFIGRSLNDVLPAEIVEILDRCLRRAHRMGSASAEMQMHAGSGTLLHLSATVALLEGAEQGVRQHLGYVLVLENATELLRAQKQSAWKEVARRVAHEIKNPLTPISLNAELIGRHVQRLQGLLKEHGLQSQSPTVMARSAEVISTSVDTMRLLVDQFSALAEFPSAQPRPADLNAIVENALAAFTGRLGTIQLRTSLARNLPLVLADPEALKRAISNLIDNAAEAMQASLLRELHVSTALVDSGHVELAVADSGPGVTDDMRERLFLPYFSTKQRGTGLGLSIASKIVQEHGGSIRVEKNVPAGARFILELRPAAGAEAEPAPLLSAAEAGVSA